MIRKDLVKAIRARKGDVLVSIQNFNDTMWVKAVKGDLVGMLERTFEADMETGLVLDNMGFLDKDYDTQY